VVGVLHPQLRVALIGGPAYEPLYSVLPSIERDLGLTFEVTLAPNHAKLNDLIASCIRRGEVPFDVISTHIKYAPSQADWLISLDEVVDQADIEPFIPDVLEHCRVNGRLVQLPRLTDARLLHLDGRLLRDRELRKTFDGLYGRDIADIRTWDDLAQVARFITDATGRHGFAFPGNASGLFGTFFELMVSAGGQLIEPDGSIGLTSPAAVWALTFLHDLHSAPGTTPRVTPDFSFDQVSEAFRAGEVAMIGDWPAYLEFHRRRATSAVNNRLILQRCPVGPAGKRAVYSGSHSFAITRENRDTPAALEFLRAITSFEAQLGEARRGAFSPRQDVQQAIKERSKDDPVRLRQLQLLEATISEDMVMFPSAATYPEVEDAVAPLLMHAIHGEMGIEPALAQSAVEALRLLGRS
jgi:multiple sugar transport system substrate-binding protein